jgi:hypothetical protein
VAAGTLAATLCLKCLLKLSQNFSRQFLIEKETITGLEFMEILRNKRIA